VTPFSPRYDLVPAAPAFTAELRYVVTGRPVTWERKRLDTRGRKPRHFTSDDQTLEMRRHQLAAIAALAPHRALWSLEGAFWIGVRGYWPDAAVGDSDRLTSLAMDALEGVLWVTDRQVRDQGGHVAVSADEDARVEVVVRRLAADPVQSATMRKRAARGRFVARADAAGPMAAKGVK
jgi:Holliday junction resolvase RusA-like endonuclease